MLPLVGFATIAAICTVSAQRLTPSVDNPRMRPLDSLSSAASLISMRHSNEEFVPMTYPDEVNYEIGHYDSDDDIDEELQRSYTEERMGKRSIALGRTGFRPGKRSLPLGRLGFRPGKRSLEDMTNPNEPIYTTYFDKRSMAMGRMGFRPGKRSIVMGRVDYRPGKRSTLPISDSGFRAYKRSLAIERPANRPGMRSFALNSLDLRPEV